ncbi:MAG: hypothetical protein ACI8ZM_002357 [Crocinitomix sp.]|jgi:hypothetical protein
MNQSTLNFLVDGKALSGFDPVTVYKQEPTLGLENMTVLHNGGIYAFTSDENKQLFESNLDKYTPKYGGYCSIAVSEGALVPANPISALIQDGELHVFYKDENEDTQDEWVDNPKENKEKAEEQWLLLNNK